jgi:hypothetical protein
MRGPSDSFKNEDMSSHRRKKASKASEIESAMKSIVSPMEYLILSNIFPSITFTKGHLS